MTRYNEKQAVEFIRAPAVKPQIACNGNTQKCRGNTRFLGRSNTHDDAAELLDARRKRLPWRFGKVIQ
jgi:hypothetical protein